MIGPSREVKGKLQPMHGTIANIPAEQVYWEETEDALNIYAVMKDEQMFSRKLVMKRKISCSLSENRMEICDTIINRGDEEAELRIMYHMNMGYPLLTEKARLQIPSEAVYPCDEHAAEGGSTWNQILPPQKQFAEQCYLHVFEENGAAEIYNPDIGLGLSIRFDTTVLPYLLQWKMMGERDYVLGLEPCNCYPGEEHEIPGKLIAPKMLAPGEQATYKVVIDLDAQRNCGTGVDSSEHAV